MDSRPASSKRDLTAEYEVLDSHLDMSFGALDDEAHLFKSSIALQMSVRILHKATYRISMFCSTYNVTSKQGTGKDHIAGHAYIYSVTRYHMQQSHTTGAQALSWYECMQGSVCTVCMYTSVYLIEMMGHTLVEATCCRHSHCIVHVYHISFVPHHLQVPLNTAKDMRASVLVQCMSIVH